ncbi:MAG: FGGY family carbohydrate kinase, partial [Terriglobia bacterium]
MDPLLLGIDVGTSNAKATLADIGGTTLWTATVPYSYQSPNPGWVEQNPEDWWKAAGSVTRALLHQHVGAPERIAAVGVSGQGVAGAFLDHEGRSLRPAMLWLDVRCSIQAERLSRDAGERIALISGKSPAAYNVEPKLLWVKENEPEVWKKTWKVMTTTAYVTFRLTGRPVMNHSDGGILLGYDLARNVWSTELLELMGLPVSVYCELAPCDQVIGEVTPEAAAATGLAAGTRVVAGGEDTSSAGLAIGVTSPEEALLSLGSACTMYIPLAEP